MTYPFERCARCDHVRASHRGIGGTGACANCTCPEFSTIHLRTEEGNQIVSIVSGTGREWAYSVPKHIPDLAVGDEVRLPSPVGRRRWFVATVARLGTDWGGRPLMSIDRVHRRHTPVS